jgi:hypothetical protein
MWHHFMNMNGVVPSDTEWGELAPFMCQLRRFGDAKVMDLVNWEAKLSALRKFNITSVQYDAAARPLEKFSVETDALPMMDVVAEGAEAGVLLPEANGVIPIPLVEDGLSLVKPEVAADIIGSEDGPNMVLILEDDLPVGKRQVQKDLYQKMKIVYKQSSSCFFTKVVATLKIHYQTS